MEIVAAVRKFWFVMMPSTRWRVVLLLCAMVVAAFLELLGLSTIPLFLGALVQTNETGLHPLFAKMKEVIAVDDRRDFFVIAALLLAAAFTIQMACLSTLAFFKARFVSRLIHEVSTTLFSGYLHAPFSFHDAQHSSTAASNIVVESTRTANQFAFPLLHMLQSSLLIFAIILFVIFVSPLSATLVLLGVACAAAVFMSVMRRRARAYGHTLTRQNQKLIEDVGEALACLKHIRLRGLEDKFERTFDTDARARSDALGFQRFVNDFPKPVLEGIAVLGLIVIVFAMSGTDARLEGTVPVLGVIGAAVARVLPHMNQLTSWMLTLYHNASSAQALVDEIRELRRDGPRNAPSTDAEESQDAVFRRVIEFKDVDYTYVNAREKSVKKLSLRIPKNSAVALVGPTGAGKSTIVDLLCGLIVPSNGEIRVDGQSMAEIRRSWQRKIGYIPQSIFLANRTLRQNVALGLAREETDDQRVWTVLEQAQLAEFVRGLPDGLETHVGENGVRLSGGQRQRVGIARALYHDPEILILDEATAALDAETERRVMSAIEAVRPNRTIVMIAHRLSSIRNFDKILVLENGQLTGQGTYNELLQRHDGFRAMAA